MTGGLNALSRHADMGGGSPHVTAEGISERKLRIATDLVAAKLRKARSQAGPDPAKLAALVWSWARQDSTFRDAIIRVFATAVASPDSCGVTLAVPQPGPGFAPWSDPTGEGCHGRGTVGAVRVVQRRPSSFRGSPSSSEPS